MQAIIVSGLLAVAFAHPLLATPPTDARSAKLDTLRAQLESDQSAERIAAAASLAKLGAAAHPALAELRGALRDKNATVRWHAAEAIGQLGDKAVPAIPDLVKQLNDTDVTQEGLEVWIASSKALASLGSPAIPPLIACLQDAKSPRYYAAAAALTTMSADISAAAPVLISQLPQTANQTKWISLLALGKTGAAAKPAIPQMIAATHDMDFYIQTAACDALAGLGPAARPAVPRLMELLRHRITSVRGHAASSLGRIGPVAGHDVVAGLLGGTSDARDSVREKSLQALARIGPQADAALDTVQKHMRNPKYSNRVNAAYAVWRIAGQHQEPLQILIQLSFHQDTDLDAIMMIGKFGPTAAAAVPKLIERLGSIDPDVRLEAAQTRGQLGSAARQAETTLKQLAANDSDADVRAQAAAAVKKISQPAPTKSTQPDGEK